VTQRYSKSGLNFSSKLLLKRGKSNLNLTSKDDLMGLKRIEKLRLPNAIQSELSISRIQPDKHDFDGFQIVSAVIVVVGTE
jgi:hypothetical protein